MLYIIFDSYKQMQVFVTSSNEGTANNISSFVYQLGLLRQRNKLLALENQNLIQKIEQLSIDLIKAQQKLRISQKDSRWQQDQKVKQKLQVSKLINSLTTIFPSNNFLIIKQMLKNQCSLQNILNTLSQQVPLLNQKQKTKQSSNLARISKQLQKRKEKISMKSNRTSQIVHIVKEPYIPMNSNTEADLEYVVRSCEKIVRRVKRQEISTQLISEVMQQIKEYITMRKTIREQQKLFRNAQRQVELGVGCRIALAQLAQHLIQLESEQLQTKEEVQRKINILRTK